MGRNIKIEGMYTIEGLLPSNFVYSHNLVKKLYNLTNITHLQCAFMYHTYSIVIVRAIGSVWIDGDLKKPT